MRTAIFKKKYLLLLAFITFFQQRGIAQITITASQTAQALAQKLAGAGVTVSNATLSCADPSEEGFFNVTSSNLGLDSGILLTSGTAAAASGPSGQTASHGWNTAAVNDPQLLALINTGTTTTGTIYDECSLEFDFVPQGDTVQFKYVFGSEEYIHGVCSQFNDVFGFFISGPGIASAQNMALVPGTNIPVAVNSVNNGTPGSSSNGIAGCNAMGPGSPFVQYYIDNSTGTSIAYQGFTQVLTAVQAVQPCNTYHLKLAIADGGNDTYDSGVFIEAGSLTTASYSVDATGIGTAGTMPYIVKGCGPGQITFRSDKVQNSTQTVKFTLGGTAVNGVDYAQLADSVIIPANANSVSLPVQGFTTNPNGTTTLVVYIYSPFNCSGVSTVVDSATLLLYDAPFVHVLSADTTICQNVPVLIPIVGDTLLQYTWAPTVGINNPNILDPIVMPDTATTYTVTGTLAGCAPVTDSYTVIIQQPMKINAGPDRQVTCAGIPVQLNVTVIPANQSYTYSWTPGTYLSSTTIPNPVSTPQTDITYIVQVLSAASCSAFDTVNIHVLPNDFTLTTPDTAICQGASVDVVATGDTSFSYSWSPTVGVSDPNVLAPVITADTSNTYYVTASYPGCPNIVHTLKLEVQPHPVVFLGNYRPICEYDTLHFVPSITPPLYKNYTYSWSPGVDFNDSTMRNVIFSSPVSTTVYLTVTTPLGCSSNDSTQITEHDINFASITPAANTDICPGDSVQLSATGGVSYHWTPGNYLSDSLIDSPVVRPTVTGEYTVYATDSFGCHDTLNVTIAVHAAATLALADSVTIYPGEVYHMDPGGNCLNFSWFPLLGLTDSAIANPVVSPEVNTKYIVHATTEWGCATVDSINVFVDPNTLLALPNAFTPGSGANNEFKIIRQGLATLNYFRIFDRWGAKVFETSNIDEGWDGTINGKAQQFGVYVYEVDAATSAGKRFYKHGNVTLLK